MFGNRAGWLLSLTIVMATAAFLFSIDYMGRRAPDPGPIGQNAASYSLVPPIDPRSVAPWMTEELDAAPIYMEVIAAHDANPRAFERYSASGRLTSPDYQAVEKAVQLLVQARKSQGVGGVFAAKPELVITYNLHRPAVKALETVGSVALKVGRQHQSAGDLPKATEIYEGIYTLGVKLAEERMAYNEWYVGRNMLTVGRWLGELPAHSAQADKFQAIDSQFKALGDKSITPVRNVIFVLNPDPAEYPSHATWTGDMIALATRAGDPMWRIEATLALGRARFQGYTRSDVRAAEMTLARLATDSNPHVQFAAKVARELTREELRRIPTVLD